jgi:nitrous oxide reductase
MPSQDAKSAPDQEGRMSRRYLLQGAAAAGAAGLAVTALGAGASPAFAAASGPAAESQGEAQAPAGPIVVHVRDAKSGDIEVFSGTSQTRLRDTDLAARIARAVG